MLANLPIQQIGHLLATLILEIDTTSARLAKETPNAHVRAETIIYVPNELKAIRIVMDGALSSQERVLALKVQSASMGAWG
jgi:hypothetical protein